MNDNDFGFLSDGDDKNIRTSITEITAMFRWFAKNTNTFTTTNKSIN
ncbi:hypothetical protein [Costertonia aggregata]|uniref:Uncharacterized protein n=1 Tax=Costertonia aggregata TaxID=343403 RepID=A0A7H9ANV0_9FLAO|nr:hypothetical protein [Costertonia aggregata]QLG45110.1 hypothetical protein HYG79_07020 [Costertonia aggregata]